MGRSPAQIQKAAGVRQSLLRAASQLVLRAGVQALTLEAVAREAGTSKGGLLHHFHSKPDLLQALMDDLMGDFEADLARFAEDDAEPCGRQTRAYIKAAAHAEPDKNRLGVALLTALLFDPALMRRWQQSTREWLAPDAAEADPIQAGVLRLAADGLWVSEAFGLHPMSPDTRTATVERLIAMTRPAVPA